MYKLSLNFQKLIRYLCKKGTNKFWLCIILIKYYWTNFYLLCIKKVKYSLLLAFFIRYMGILHILSIKVALVQKFYLFPYSFGAFPFSTLFPWTSFLSYLFVLILSKYLNTIRKLANADILWVRNIFLRVFHWIVCIGFLYYLVCFRVIMLKQ